MSALAYKIFASRWMVHLPTRFRSSRCHSATPHFRYGSRARKHLILDSVGIALASTKYPFASVPAALEESGNGHLEPLSASAAACPFVTPYS